MTDIASSVEDGMVTNDDAIAEELRLLRSHGITSLSYDRHKGHAFSYDVVRTSYDYRATEITAALVLVQLEKLQRNNARRAELTALYRDRLSGSNTAPLARFGRGAGGEGTSVLLEPLSGHGLTIPFARHPGVSSCHRMPILLPPGADRQAFMTCLRNQGIQTSIHYPPIHRFPAYCSLAGPADGSLPNTDDAALREVTFRLHPLMTVTEVEVVCGVVLRSCMSPLTCTRTVSPRGR